MKYIPLDVKTDQLTATNFIGGPADIQVVHGDKALLLCKFKKQNIDSSEYEAIDFTADGGAPSDLRVTVRQTRSPSATLLTSQYTYNAGDFEAAFEDLTLGQVTWLLDFTSAGLTAAFAAAAAFNQDTIQAWLEITYLDNAGKAPTTLLQKKITIRQQVDAT